MLHNAEPSMVMGIPISDVSEPPQSELPKECVLKDEVVDPDSKEVVELNLEQSLVFQHSSSSSLSGTFDLPPAWAWSDTQGDNVKENLVNVVWGQSVKSDIEQITFKKRWGVMSIGAVKTRLTDILLMQKESLYPLKML